MNDLERCAEKPKFKELLDLLCRLVVKRRTGVLKAKFSEGGIVSVFFEKKEI